MERLRKRYPIDVVLVDLTGCQHSQRNGKEGASDRKNSIRKGKQPVSVCSGTHTPEEQYIVN